MTPNEKDSERKKINFNTQYVKYLLVLILGCLVGVFGSPYLYTQGGRSLPFNPAAIKTTAISTENAEKLDRTYKILKNGYLEKISENDLVNGAIRGMTEATGDPYTQYLDEEETSAFSETIDSEFEGIGATLSQEGTHIIIMSPIKDTPAEKAGLLPNDEIIAVDGKEIQGLTLQKVVNRVRGEKGTNVTLTIRRGSNDQDITLTRDSIPIHTVQFHLDEKNPTVGIVEISGFSRPTDTEFKDAITQLREDGASRFVIDVRQNPGGLLDQALKISNMFLKDGDTILKVADRNNNEQSFVASKEYGDFKITEPSVVLIDNGSASASEILAGALSQSGHIKLIGTNSFGKGTVQTTEAITDQTELKYTMSKWLTPNGTWIHGKGLSPDIEVERPRYAKLLLVIPSDELVIGAENEQVLNLNQVLNALGYDVEPSLIFSGSTKNAIENFQVDNQLEVTGTINDETATQLTREIREKIKHNDTQLERAISEVLK